MRWKFYKKKKRFSMTFDYIPHYGIGLVENKKSIRWIFILLLIDIGLKYVKDEESSLINVILDWRKNLKWPFYIILIYIINSKIRRRIYKLSKFLNTNVKNNLNVWNDLLINEM